MNYYLNDSLADSSTKNDRCQDATHGYFHMFFKIVDLALRAVIDFFLICSINSLRKKKISRLISLCPKIYLGQHNQNKTKKYYYYPNIPSFKHKPLLNIFTFAMIFLFLTMLSI